MLSFNGNITLTLERVRIDQHFEHDRVLSGLQSTVKSDDIILFYKVHTTC